MWEGMCQLRKSDNGNSHVEREELESLHNNCGLR